MRALITRLRRWRIAHQRPWWARHRRDIPDALCKAFGDPFSYALGLRNGQVIEFQSAELRPGRQWVFLDTGNSQDKPVWNTDPMAAVPMISVPMIFDRGIEVRLCDIVWVADAPHGS
jgi:hypothetical protein